MIKIIKLNLFCILSFLLLSSYKQAVIMVAGKPTIIAGKGEIIGRIITPDVTKDSLFVEITVSHPISGEYAKYRASVDQWGKFSITVDVEMDISLVSMYTSLNPEKYLLVKVMNGYTTNIEISYNSNGTIDNSRVTPEMAKYDMTRGIEVMTKMIEHRGDRAPQPLYNKSKKYFHDYAKTILSERLEIVNNDTLLSKELKEILSKDFRLFLYIAHVFPYEEEMIRNYRNTNDDKSKKPEIQKIDRSYFSFLKDFNLNDQQYLYCFTFLEFQKAILQNETLALPEIGETDISSWLAIVKTVLSDLVGFDNGQYYDILAANAYARQLNEEVKPLTDKQKKNILLYWKKGEIAKILFRKNQQVVELHRLKSPSVVNDISSVSDDKVVEAIVSKHKNKVVLIDLWATWCAPCLDAMQQFRSSKSDFRGKDVAFVYVTDPSSPRNLWEEKIKGIGNEHYYLKNSQWKYLMDHYGFNSIPSYLLFNKEGVLIDKFTAFPGNDKVKEMINSLL